ncbi:hypothetical protein HF576_04135 [Microbacterium sp. CFH 90308]|uniref:Uncharacterized protein n=1 Tax=Microbacterium salsuginis TaxID=2722803 RepID=A0ABX1KA67_9MICO|nr:hypothetical protein [Microbacterium sp. CFH 90308]NLP83025.1 hypothetical protein [Microbacterium sp. CFH 90308]
MQLAGTALFNVSTFAATRESLALDQEKHLIWAPDLWGSVCFLVASALACKSVHLGTGAGKLGRALSPDGAKLAALRR